MSEATTFIYRAFVSYSSRDRLVGERFQRELERYKIPRALRGRRTSTGIVPKRIAPIFRDRSDLVASDDLNERIVTALIASEALILLCSPHSARSQWVHQEIAMFKRLGREQQITAVLIDGDPAMFDPVTAPSGAFPPPLLQHLGPDGKPTGGMLPVPFAPDLREMAADGSGGDGFELAKLKVVARLIDVPLAELTQRQRAVERRERRIIQAVAGGMFVLAVAATTGGWLAWRQTLEANARLDQTIDMAARQIGTAAQYESRYGVSSAVIGEMLRSAQDDFAGLLQSAGTTPRLGLQAARLGLSFAEAFEDAGDREGRHAKALADAQKELERLESRSTSLAERVGLSTAPSSEDVARARLRLLAARARRATEAGETDKALGDLNARLELATAWSQRSPESEWPREVALTHLRQGNAHYEGGQPEKSIAAYQAGIAGIERLVAAGPSPRYREDLLRGVSDLAQILSEAGQHREALQQQERAEGLARGLAADRPADTERQLSLVMVLTRVGDAILNISGDQAKAVAKYVEAESLVRGLATSDPQRIDWQRALYIVLERLGSARFQTDGATASEPILREALDIVERLAATAPDDPRRLYDAGVMQERMGQLRMAQAEAAASEPARSTLQRQAADVLKRLVATRERAAKANPGGKIQAYHLAVALLTLGDVRASIGGQEGEGSALIDRAQDLLGDLTREADPRLDWFRTLAATHVKRAQHHMRASRNEAAVSELEKALLIIRDLRKREPANERFPQDEAELSRQINELKSPK